LRRRGRQGCWRFLRTAGHGALGIEQVILARPQAQTDQRPRVGNFLGLPAVIALISPHGVFARLIPRAGRLSAQIMLANQRFLNGASSLRVNLLLTAPPGRSSLPRVFPGRGAVSRGGFRCGSRWGRAWRLGGWCCRGGLRSRGLHLSGAAARGLARACW